MERFGGGVGSVLVLAGFLIIDSNSELADSVPTFSFNGLVTSASLVFKFSSFFLRTIGLGLDYFLLCYVYAPDNF